MSKTLVLAERVLSIRGRVGITDEQGQQCSEGRGDFSLLHTRWRIFRDTDEVALIKKKFFALRPTFRVSGELGEFVMQRKLLSLRRHYRVIGGTYDGAIFSGGIFDLNFKIEHNGKLLAQAQEKLVSLRDKHRLEVLSDDRHDELFTVIAMVVMQMEKHADD